ncbi:testis prostate and placenta-expressed protein [Biomphalaria pfeifferi]|uniref:Testis prostate and placenta-expressed protein n=1 Tax=Biomphalaria pfeifferi TaxID=112525 RepID=A0AAD8EVZ5_BIOPF|nr:testis prostate and placenta-expressed protein [Biomphalaria pfeifferi]
MTTIGVCKEQPWRVDVLAYPSYNYPYPSFRQTQLDACIAQRRSRRPPMFRRLTGSETVPGTTRSDLDTQTWLAKEDDGLGTPTMPLLPPIQPVEPSPDPTRPNLNPKEYARWRFETSPLVTTHTRSDWSNFLNRCPERFCISLPLEKPGNGLLPYYDGGYALRYLRPGLNGGIGIERWSERPFGYIQGPSVPSPYRTIKVNNALAGL